MTMLPIHARPLLAVGGRCGRRLLAAAFLPVGLLALASVPPGCVLAQPDDYAAARIRMVELQLEGSGCDVRDPRVLQAMAEVPRHEFVPPPLREYAYSDSALPIGFGQTISQPYVVAFMTERLEPKPSDRVLEIGTGSGYQAAVLSKLVAEVYTIEIVEPLGRRAEADLRRLGFDNVRVRIGDGYRGWPEAAPFDAIILTSAVSEVPQPLIGQLKDGGRLIAPLGPSSYQELYLLKKRGEKLERRAILPVRFVPMTGEVLKGAPP
ncbi:protein-L-isoaspartate(D-aspartate) O-methyltransferase [Methylococcus capsulatus]|jgi:protein-L-isoaspartate(D-aspartate) O-methyltransferase|uniref:Protein-L-isoaspartate O-methyltransferase n=1 Tax=Methylococcus capsulatus TaxID=414 RepID=A0AA35XTN3_METCP|nr:protein-L-isoaspartate(D-aspartate) O-methyltransferase [Methylococcus capsulatus]CAI8808927.1 Protein-L-isoaspartate O-methyltransferase 2 [Methylococcus capsulatus]